MQIRQITAVGCLCYANSQPVLIGKQRFEFSKELLAVIGIGFPNSPNTSAMINHRARRFITLSELSS
jgi:hypothetical protein